MVRQSVAQMAKVKKWDDVRLLSFDLQTVEFAYAKVRLLFLPSPPGIDA